MDGLQHIQDCEYTRRMYPPSYYSSVQSTTLYIPFSIRFNIIPLMPMLPVWPLLCSVAKIVLTFLVTPRGSAEQDDWIKL
jgi:hypothetical protein